MKREELICCVLVLGLACVPAEPAGPSQPGDGPTTAEGECINPPVYTEDVSSCQPLSSDYRPRANGSVDDAWPACISDDNTYHRVEQTVSTIARVESFEQIAAKLLAPGKVPSAQDFLDARVLYAQDQGLDSRVQRREDVHYPVPEGGKRCSDAGVPEQYPDRCVGPSRLLPVLNEAFVKGFSGEQPRVQAARIEAALLWFLYTSALSEVMSCTDRPRDCDSAWAYYTGGTERGQPLGLARYVWAQGLETHERAYDALLGVRCWRGLDTAVPAARLDLRDQAREQLDRALLRGVSLVVRQRFAELACTAGEARQARVAFLQVVVPLLDRAARERSAAQADVLQAQLAKAAEGGEVDVGAALAALEQLFSCP